MTVQPVWHPSPNFGERKAGAVPDLVVLHYTAMEQPEPALRVLCDPACEVSAHYLIARDGTVYQMVDEAKRAWHAGAGSWGGVSDVNSRSIGIEMCNTGFAPFSEPLMAALEQLLAGILVRWSIPAHRVIGHSDMAPGRKIDPGARFDWQRLARLGLAVWPTPVAGQGESFRALAGVFGYPDMVEDDTVLAAFRLRFRPGAQGPVCDEDLAILRDLAVRYPVDQPLSSA